jgi:predicted HicB family RNase H-like nuclease
VTRIHYEIPDEVHRQAKIAAATQGITLKDFIIAAIEVAADTEGTKK